MSDKLKTLIVTTGPAGNQEVKIAGQSKKESIDLLVVMSKVVGGAPFVAKNHDEDNIEVRKGDVRVDSFLKDDLRP